MKITDLQVSISTAAAILIAAVGWMTWASNNLVFAEDMEDFQINEAIKNDRLWVELLEQKLYDAKSTEEQEKIKRQLERTEKSLYINMEKKK